MLRALDEKSWPDAVMHSLAEHRPVFHSEADFQHAFAWQAHVRHPTARIRLELRPDPDVRETVDMLCVIGGERIAVEFKYLVRRFEVTIDGEAFRLHDQGAQPLSRYDVVKDIERLERFCLNDGADVGHAVVLSNDALMWSPGRTGSVDEGFRLHDGAVLGGTLAWAVHAGKGTTRGRERAISLRNSYAVTWQSFPTRVAECTGHFRYLVLSVKSGHGLAALSS